MGGMLEAQMLLDDASVATTASPHTPNGSVVPEVVLNDVCLSTPDGKFKLSQHLNLVVDRSTSVIIIGASGCGKSSLLRAISGLWEPTSGCISLPGNHTPMFLPQSVYIPDIPLEDNTLQAQLLFPRDAAQLMWKGDSLEKYLKIVNLGHLINPEMGILTTGKWREQLSGGEKQRLAMARLLIANPKIAFLDESTSALDPVNESKLYKALQARKATYISVGHDGTQEVPFAHSGARTGRYMGLLPIPGIHSTGHQLFFRRLPQHPRCTSEGKKDL